MYVCEKQAPVYCYWMLLQTADSHSCRSYVTGSLDLKLTR
jgi:hypothetical protein